jgi:hypothetical protein
VFILLVIVSLASIVLHHLCNKRKTHKNTREIQQCLLTHAVMYSLQTAAKSILFFNIRFTSSCFIRGKRTMYLYVRPSVCVFRCFS